MVFAMNMPQSKTDLQINQTFLHEQELFDFILAFWEKRSKPGKGVSDEAHKQMLSFLSLSQKNVIKNLLTDNDFRRLLLKILKDYK